MPNYVYGQTYPAKPVRIVTAAAGGGADFAARLIALGLGSGLGQQVIVDNRGGAGGIIAIDMIAKSPPDGYNLLVYSDAMWTLPLMISNAPYDAVRDFAPITAAVASPQVIVVHPSVPVKTVKDLIALARVRPGALNYATPGAGSSTHLHGELFKAMAGVDIVHVPYKGQAPATGDLIAGQVQLMFASAAVAMPHVKSGRLRVLAVTSATPSALYPGLPTVSSSGLPGYEAVNVYATLAPANTPVAIIRRLHQEIVRALDKPEMREKFSGVGAEVVGSTPEELAATIKAGIARLGKVVRDQAIRAD